MKQFFSDRNRDRHQLTLSVCVHVCTSLKSVRPRRTRLGQYSIILERERTSTEVERKVS